MSTTYISAELRRTVTNRAEGLCEYCLIHEDDTFFGCHIDHVISEKHGGLTEANNLAYACTFCNLHKGSDIASITESGALTRLFDPRVDKWSEHFVLVGNVIQPLTAIGEVTVQILRFNHSDQLLERQELINVKRYPSEPAARRME
jgi:hypothetical protein